MPLTKANLRNIIAISLFFILFISQAGYYFYYTANRESLRAEMKEHLLLPVPVQTPELIVEEDNQIRWEEKGKEFYLDGILYDVAGTEKRDGKTILYCARDIKEDALVKAVAKIVGLTGETTNSGNSGKYSLKYQLNEYYFHTFNKLVHADLVDDQQYAYSGSEAIYSSCLGVNVPPPRA